MRSAVGRWLLSIRPLSFSASIIPVALAAALALERASAGAGAPGANPAVIWWPMIPYALAALLLHAGTNVLNDYWDFRHGVDTPDNPDPTHVLVRGLVSPRFMFVSGQLYFALAIAIGATIGLVRGPGYVALGLAGAAGAWLYTGGRVSLKYVALGDILVFALMGPALVVMGEWALTGSVTSRAAVISLPIALLVTAILHANNLRDIDRDRAAGITTLATILGRRSSVALLTLLLVSPYALTAALVVAGAVTPWALATLGTGGLALRPLRAIRRGGAGDHLALLPLEAALAHLGFGLVYVASIAGTALIAGGL